MEKINVGLNPNDGQGDSLRDAFIKVNNNIDETYTKEQVDQLIEDVEVDLSNYDTKAEVNTKITNALAPYETTASVNTKLNLKADKTQLVGLATQAWVLLQDYASKTYVNEAIENISSISFLLVDELPTTGEANKIYLVPNGETGNNVKDEYIWVENKWEMIGNTDIDLSDYYTKSETDGLLDDKLDINSWEQYVEVEEGRYLEFTNFQNYVTITFYTKAEIDSKLALLATQDEVEVLDAQNVKLTGDQTKSGVLTLTSSPIVPTPTTGTQAANKDYVDSKASPIGIIGLGLRRLDTEQSYYYGIGNKAVDLSEATFQSSGSFQLGALGDNSFAGGTNNLTSGYGTVAFGNLNKVYGNNSVAFGSDNTINSGCFSSLVSGYTNTINTSYSLSFGERNITNHYAGLTFGRFNNPILGSPQNTWTVGSPIMIVGNGTSNAAKSNAYVLFNNGTSTQYGIASYGADYSATFTARSLVDKAYVDSKSSPITKNASGGFDLATDSILPLPTLTGKDSLNLQTRTTGDPSIGSAQGLRNVLMNENNSITASWATNNLACGHFNKVGGYSNFSIGYQNTIGNSYGIVLGAYNTALGSNSIVLGDQNVAYHYCGITLGQYNNPILSTGQNSWVNGSPIIIVGNGTSSSAKSNAYVMYNNGNSTQNGIASYGADYSATYTNRSLVDKGYVLNPETFIELLTAATPTQLDQIKTLLGIA